LFQDDAREKNEEWWKGDNKFLPHNSLTDRNPREFE